MAALKLQDVTKALGQLSLTIAQTRDVAFTLGVELTELDNIDDERKGIDRTKYYMQAWLNGDEQASWEMIVRALRCKGLNRQDADLERICGEFSTQTPVSTG